MLPQEVSDDQFSDLVECMVSLAVRSPLHREQAVSLAESLRGPLPERERNVLIGTNMRRSQQNAVKNIRGRGKIAIILSAEREFIFGDGFFQHITPPVQHLTNPKMLVPLTPWMAAVFARPMSYRIDPRLVTLTASADEVDAFNHAVQVYARKEIFYRTERPIISKAYEAAKHLMYSDDRNAVDSLIYSLPGIPERDDRFDFFSETHGL